MRVAPWLLVAGAGILLAVQGRCAGEREGALAAKVAAREAVIAALAKQQARVDTVRARSRAVALDSAAAYQTLRDSILAMLPAPTDSVPTEGTVVPPIIRAADAAIASCHRALRDCDNAISVRDSLVANMDTLLRLERQRRPGRFGCVLGPTVTQKGFGLGGSCGFRIK